MGLCWKTWSPTYLDTSRKSSRAYCAKEKAIRAGYWACVEDSKSWTKRAKDKQKVVGLIMNLAKYITIIIIMI